MNDYPPSDATRPSFVSKVAPFVLVAVGVAAYANSVRGVFLFDDYKHIVDNEAIRHLTSPSGYLSDRRAVTEATFAINYAVSGLEVWSYHVVNILIHVAATLTLFGIVRRTAHRVLRDDARSAEGDRLALVIALVWLVHPLQTQSVTYLIQRGESFMGLFYLLCLYAVIRAAGARRAWPWCVLAVAAAAAGMASKAVMITAPIVVLVYDRMFLAASWRELLRRRGRLHAMIMATWGVLLLCGIAQAILVTKANPDVNVGFAYKGISPVDYALTQPEVILYYLWLALWPDVLCLDYQWPAVASFREAALPLAIVGVLLVATIVGVIKRHWLGFVGVWFFVILAPTSSVVPIKDVIFEHRMYLPLAAVVTVLVVAVHAVLRRLATAWRWSATQHRVCTAALVSVATASLGWRTIQRNEDYASAEAMWRSVIAARPDSDRAYVGLGAAQFRSGRYDEAVRSFKEAIRLTPRYADAHYNLAAAEAALDHWPEAIDEYRRAVALAPTRTRYGIALGQTLSYLGRFDDAAKAFADVLRVDAGSVEAATGRANALADAGHDAEAVEAFDQALRLAPDSAELLINAGNALRRVGRTEDAVARYRRAVEIDPTRAAGHSNLGAALAELGRFDEAAAALRQGIALDPEPLPPYRALAAVYRRLGDLESARAVARQALTHDPNTTWAKHLLEPSANADERDEHEPE